MLKKTITYKDYNGEEATDELFFHLSKAELIEMEMEHEGGMLETLNRIIAAEDNAALIREFKHILLQSYGVRSADGKRFTKNQRLREEFESTEAYSTLFMQLVTDTDAAIEFFNGIVPDDMAPEMAKVTALEEAKKPEETPNQEIETISRMELTTLSTNDFTEVQKRIAAGEVKIVE